MRYRTYNDWINAIYQAERDAVDASSEFKLLRHYGIDEGQSEHRTYNKNETSMGSERNRHPMAQYIDQYPAYTSIDSRFVVQFDKDGVIRVHPNDDKPNKTYAHPTMLITGRCHEGKNYTGYSIQMRPANYFGNWKLIAPIGFTRKIKVNTGNQVTVYDLDGTTSRSLYYHCPQAEDACCIQATQRPSKDHWPAWIWYDEDGKLVLPNDKGWVTNCWSTRSLQYCHRSGEYIFRNKHTTNDRFHGRSKTSDAFYKSIASHTTDKYTDGTVDRHAMMLLTAKCHKAAINFANNSLNGKVTLLPMLDEKYVNTDCRSFSSSTGYVSYNDSYRSDDDQFEQLSSCARRVHYLNKTPTAGKGVLMPTILVTYESSPDEEEFHTQPAGFTWMRTVAITIPPVLTAKAMQGKLSDSLKDFACSTIVKAPFDLSEWRGLEGRFGYEAEERCIDAGVLMVDDPEYDQYVYDVSKINYCTPRSSFLALREAVTSRGSKIQNEREFSSLLFKTSSQTDNYMLMEQMKDACFDFRYSKSHVAVSYHKTMSGRQPVYERYPVAKRPEEIFIDVEAEALLDSLPIT